MNTQPAKRVSGQYSLNRETRKGNYQGSQTALIEDCSPRAMFLTLVFFEMLVLLQPACSGFRYYTIDITLLLGDMFF